MRLVYVAGPYTGANTDIVTHHLEMASAAGREVLAAGLVPVIPHRITAFWDLREPFQSWMNKDWLEKFCYPLLQRCDMAYFYPGWHRSPGANDEKDYCEKNAIPFGFNVNDLLRIAEKMRP